MSEAFDRPASFWTDVCSFRGAVTRPVIGRVVVLGLYAWLFCGNRWVGHFDSQLAIGLTPYEVAGAALGLLMVLRVNAGYERWWEGRKLWGGIVNHCRHLAVVAVAYGPEDPGWRDRAIRLTSTFAHVVRRSLRGERTLPEVDLLLGSKEAAQIAGAHHMPGYVVQLLANHFRLACDPLGMDRFAFLQADSDLRLLLEDLGGCERIRKTPLPRGYSIVIRQFLVLFLASLPFALFAKVGWLTPIVVVLTAYPLLAIDEIGQQLQFPFSEQSLNPLPLDAICATIEADVTAMLANRPVDPPDGGLPATVFGEPAA